MLQLARFAFFMALIPVYLPLAIYCELVEAATGEDPSAPEGDGIQREPEGYQRFKRCDR